MLLVVVAHCSGWKTQIVAAAHTTAQSQSLHQNRPSLLRGRPLVQLFPPRPHQIGTPLRNVAVRLGFDAGKTVGLAQYVFEGRGRTRQRPGPEVGILEAQPERQIAAVAAAHRDKGRGGGHVPFLADMHRQRVEIGHGLFHREIGKVVVTGNALTVVAMLGKHHHGPEFLRHFKEESAVPNELVNVGLVAGVKQDAAAIVCCCVLVCVVVPVLLVDIVAEIKGARMAKVVVIDGGLKNVLLHRVGYFGWGEQGGCCCCCCRHL